MTRHILAIDQGTTNTKALLIDPQGQVVAEASCALAVEYPRPGWVEQDPLAIWQSVREAVAACLAQAVQAGESLAAVAITNQRESVVAWERATGRPVGPVVVWQCRRTADLCRELVAQGLAETIHQRTGLQIDPLFSGSKARWLLDHLEDGRQRAERGEICVGTMDSWVLWNLSGGAVHACDMSNASRTQLFNLHTLRWDEELLDMFGVPLAALPDVCPSSQVYAETVALDGLPAGVPIASLIGDSHGALYGHAGFAAGAVKATYGTGSSLMTPIPAPKLSAHGLSTTIAWARETPAYALEGNISVTGAAVQWLEQLLGQPDTAAGAAAIERLAGSVEDTGGVYFVPAFVGLGAPHWRESARGLIAGLTRGSTPAHLARATLEAIAYQVRDVYDVMQAEAGAPLSVLMADGGATRNDLLMQFQADILGCPVWRSRPMAGGGVDVSAMGAAYLAGLAVGVWRSEDEIAALPRPEDRFAPRLAAERRQALYAGWREAVARTVYEPAGD